MVVSMTLQLLFHLLCVDVFITYTFALSAFLEMRLQITFCPSLNKHVFCSYLSW